MSKPAKPTPRPLSGGTYTARDGVLQQDEAPTAAPIGKSARRALDAAATAKAGKALKGAHAHTPAGSEPA